MHKVLNFAHFTVFCIKDNLYLPCSAAMQFHNITYSNVTTIQIQHCSCIPQFLYTGKTDPICHAQCSNYIAASHNTTHSSCTSTFTAQPPLPTRLPSTTLLCTCLTYPKHICVSGSKITQTREGAKVKETFLWLINVYRHYDSTWHKSTESIHCSHYGWLHALWQPIKQLSFARGHRLRDGVWY